MSAPLNSARLAGSSSATTGWESAPCAVCGGVQSRPVLVIPFPEAPGGASAVVECSGCGLRRLDPRPGAATIGGYYSAAAGGGYNAYVGRKRSPRTQAIWDLLRDGFARPAVQPAWSRVLSPVTGAVASWAFDINVPLRRRTGLRVLEVGAGFGDILIYLRQRGCEVCGTDLSPDAVAKGREYGLEMHLGHLREAGLASASFDAAIMCHSLEHVPDPRAELGELARLIKPGGTLHVAVPNGHAVRLDLDGLGWAHLSFPLHFWYFDARNLTRLLAEYGFTPVAGPATTTRHHAFNEWRHDFFRRGPVASTQRFLKFLVASAGRRDGGDVLRVTAVRGG